jgi:VWFA-related protein
MSLKSTYVSLLLILTTIYTYGQGQPVSPRITGQEGAAGAQMIINEVNTDQYPQVRIFATVLKDGAPLKGLSAADFRVREDEVDQEPITVEPKLPPLSVVITLDTSGSMAKRMKETQAAAKSFLDTLGSNDSAQVVSFAREVKRLTTMSTNRQAAREAIGSIMARGDTALYDALYESIQLVKDRTGRKAIVLLSDGVDDDGTGKPLSKRTVKEVIGLARAVNVPIYVLGLGTDIDEAVLTEVAKATGALYFNAPQARELTALYAKIGEQLSGQYAISYTCNLPADGTEHRVALTSQSVTDTKTYKAPEKDVVPRLVQQAPKPPSKEEKEASVSGIGTFEFKWPGGDCWQVLRGDGKVASHCGSSKQALQAGTYTVKPRHKPIFEPFNVTIENGVKTTAP